MDTDIKMDWVIQRIISRWVDQDGLSYTEDHIKMDLVIQRIISRWVIKEDFRYQDGLSYTEDHQRWVIKDGYEPLDKSSIGYY